MKYGEKSRGRVEINYKDQSSGTEKLARQNA